jgi:hypothetical protein
LDDAIIVTLLAGEARRRLFTQLFGTSGKGQPLFTMAVCNAIGQAFRDMAAPVVAQPGPSAADILLGLMALREVSGRVAGEPSRQTPNAVGLIVVALIWRYRPLMRGSMRAARGSSHAAEATVRRLRAFYGGRS